MVKHLKYDPDLRSFLRTPLCQIPLKKRGSIALKCLEQVRLELKSKGINFNFHYWASDDWFCPDGITGIAIPFYLFNEQALTLEQKYIGHAEGKTEEECLKLIRHELGHAIDNAFHLRDCEERREIFGDHRIKYPKEYIKKPFSRSYVLHLGDNYAQAHPEEDWAETFAVWLDPKSNWKEKYKDWKALKKLEYVDSIMTGLRGKRAKTICRDTLDEISTLGISYKSYLSRKLKNKSKYKAPLFKKNINRVFSSGKRINALSYLKVHEREICIRVAKNTNQYHYIIKDVMRELKNECRERNLTLRHTRRETHAPLINMLSKSTLQYVKQGKHKVIM